MFYSFYKVEKDTFLYAFTKFTGHNTILNVTLRQ